MSEPLDPRRDYFEYLENVLGIKTILQSQSSLLSDVSPVLISTELLFCVQNYKTYTAEETDLLYKMIASVKVAPERLQVCDMEDAGRFATQCLVVFEDEVHATNSFPVPAQLTVQTFSPRVLLQKPQLKRQAWIELQKILQRLA